MYQSSQHALDDAMTTKEINKAVKDIFREVFHQLGGAQWLVDFVQDDPANARIFVQALVKMIPTEKELAPAKSAVVIDLPWVRHDRLSYRSELEGPTLNGEVYTEN